MTLGMQGDGAQRAIREQTSHIVARKTSIRGACFQRRISPPVKWHMNKCRGHNCCGVGIRPLCLSLAVCVFHMSLHILSSNNIWLYVS